MSPSTVFAHESWKAIELDLRRAEGQLFRLLKAPGDGSQASIQSTHVKALRVLASIAFGKFMAEADKSFMATVRDTPR